MVIEETTKIFMADDNGEIAMIANGIVVGDMSFRCRLSKCS